MRDLIKALQTKFKKWTEQDIGIQPNPILPLERIGTPYGGWIIPKGIITQQSVCYLVGAGEDISFDLGLAHLYGCAVHIFDPTPRSIAHVQQVKDSILKQEKMPCGTSPDGYYLPYPVELAERLHFHSFGIWDTDGHLQFYSPENQGHVSHSLVNLQKSEKSIEVPVHSLPWVLDHLGHTHIDLLKLDVEGAEYQIITSILAMNLTVNILCVEFDETASNHLDKHYLSRIKTCLENLQKAGYEIIAKEPDCRNYTLLHSRCLSHS